jgi:hypothetical protein
MIIVCDEKLNETTIPIKADVDVKVSSLSSGEIKFEMIIYRGGKVYKWGEYRKLERL